LIIFLDFDGVLHPDAVYTIANLKHNFFGEGALFMHTPILEKLIEPYPELKIVLSTNWARRIGYENTRNKLPIKLQERVVGATLHTQTKQMYQDPYGSNISRFEQIEWHASNNDIKQWLATDDLFSGTEIKKWSDDYRHLLVLTEQSKGLACLETQSENQTKLMELYRQSPL